jgi:hypothetical protein
MIQLNHLQLTIEAECQRQLFEGIKEFCEIRETVICSSACTSVSMPRSDWSDVLNGYYVVCQVVLHIQHLVALLFAIHPTKYLCGYASPI